MSAIRSFNVDLPDAIAEMVEAKVASGEYASRSAVVREGLEIIAERDASIEAWLRDEVLPTYDAVMSDPDSTFSSSEAWDRIEMHMVSAATGSR